MIASVVSRARSRAPLLLLAILAAACGDASGPRFGALAVRLSGLPDGASATVRVTGPGGVARMLTTSDTLTDLEPGDYTLVATDETVRGAVYTPVPPTLTVRVAAGAAAAQATVAFALTTGSLVIDASGLDDGVRPTYMVSGNGVSHTLAGGDTLAGLRPGRYTLAATPVTGPADSWAPTALAQEVEVSVSAAPTRATVAFALTTGRIALDVVDLPAALGAAVTVSNEAGYSMKLDGRRTITGLAPGRYTITGQGGTVSGEAWIAQPASQQVDVAAGAQPTAALVRFMPRPPLDLAVAGVTVVQAVQRTDNSVPLVADRAAVLRVFVQATEPNEVRPRLRVRWYVDGALRQTFVLDAPNGAVPTERHDNDLGASWNATIPAELLRPGAAVRVDVDPENQVREHDEQNNEHPAAGPLALDVRVATPLRVRFVPIAMTVPGTTGTITAAEVSRFLDLTNRIFPLSLVEADVRAPLVTSAAALQSNDGNGAWQQILRELQAARIAESSPETWYGVVKAPYTSGVAGLGYIGYPAAMGWDALPSASSVMAHELGHTWGRFHAPCGQVAGSDSQYPYPGGFVGQWGMDVANLRLKDRFSTDLMGYCGNAWISDYTWTGVLNFRAGRLSTTAAATAGAVVSSGPEQAGLLVWGQVAPDGAVTLEPAFAVRARPSLPARGGAYRVRGVAADGGELFSLSFDPTAIGDGRGGAFAFVVPLDEAQRERLASLRATGPRGERRLSARAPRAADVRSERAADGRRRVRWDAATLPAALARDAATGRVLGIVRGGDARLPGRGAVELTLSDGVRSRTVRVD